MNLLEATYVQLRGTVNIAGRMANNIDASRDGCVLHLHEETGGVFVTYGVSDNGEATLHTPSPHASSQASHSHYIAGVGVESVDLKDALTPVHYIAPTSPSFAPQIAQAELDETNNAADRAQDARKSQQTLADEVLAEFQDTDAKPHPRRKKK